MKLNNTFRVFHWNLESNNNNGLIFISKMHIYNNKVIQFQNKKMNNNFIIYRMINKF